jgi:phage gpG-like protein
MASVDLDVSFNIDELDDELKAIKRRSKNFRSPLEQVKEDLEKAWAGNFAANGLPVGGWAPLDAEYGSWKSAHFPGAPPMVRSGKLFKSLASLRGAGSEIGARGASFGTDVEYAKFHQMGTTRMAKRQILFEPVGAAQRWSEAMADHMAGKKIRDVFS